MTAQCKSTFGIGYLNPCGAGLRGQVIARESRSGSP